MSTRDFDLTDTQFGFTWGPLTVTRLMDDPKFGVIIEVKAGTNVVEVRATPNGRNLEWRTVA